MSSRLDQALDEVIRDRRTERGYSNNDSKKRNNNFNTRRENGGGGIRKRGGGGGGGYNNTSANSSLAIRSFVRTVNVMEERRGGAGRTANGQWSHDMFDDDDVPRNSILTRLGTARGGQGERTDRGVEICVENLHYNVNEDDVKELFNTVGNVTKAKIKFDQSGRSTGVALISYQSESDAKKAIEKYNGIELDGQDMRIKMNERAAPKLRSSGGRFNNDRLSNRLGSRLGGINDRRSNNNRDDRDDLRPKRRNNNNRPNKTVKNSDRQKKIPTSEDLDREMESYMQTNTLESNGAPFDEDIEMIFD